MLAILSYNSKALWYLTRGFGLVALVLLTISVLLGVIQTVRFVRPGVPRFVVFGLHRNVSLLAVVAIGIHVATAVMDSYAPIRAIDVFVPFVSRYRPVWTGLGALAVDLLIALVLTSLLRNRLGYRTWRLVHWLAYACWPVAVLHGLGTGTDTRLGWVQVLYLGCTAVVVVSVWWRLAKGLTTEVAAVRGVAAVASVALPLAVFAWTVSGPLRPGWARRSGTPAALLGSSVRSTSRSSSQGSGASGQLVTPLSASFAGVQSTGPSSGNGLVSVTVQGGFRGTEDGELTVVLTGEAARGGGVILTNSEVFMGPVSSPHLLDGHVTSLSGPSLSAELADSSGKSYTANLRLNASSATDRVTGLLTVSS